MANPSSFVEQFTNNIIDYNDDLLKRIERLEKRERIMLSWGLNEHGKYIGCSEGCNSVTSIYSVMDGKGLLLCAEAECNRFVCENCMSRHIFMTHTD